VKVQVIRPQYVEQLPDQMEEGVLYICEEFDLTAHKCCCGCGEDVYNKLSPAKWRLTKMPDGSVSLYPSVGNWKYACKSHYWISKNRVIDAGPMGARAIEAVQQRDRRDRDRYIARVNAQPDPERRMNLWGRTRPLFARTLRRLKALWPW
jgi:Family of unknown function (DUF6527)